jgi:hypothetical protein
MRRCPLCAEPAPCRRCVDPSASRLGEQDEGSVWTVTLLGLGCLALLVVQFAYLTWLGSIR